jgi:hypothetical protein
MYINESFLFISYPNRLRMYVIGSFISAIDDDRLWGDIGRNKYWCNRGGYHRGIKSRDNSGNATKGSGSLARTIIVIASIAISSTISTPSTIVIVIPPTIASSPTTSTLPSTIGIGRCRCDCDTKDYD